MPLDLPPISRSAPQGAHTAKSNSVRPPAAHRDRKRRGGRAGGLGARAGACDAVRTATLPGSDSRYTIDRSRKRRGGRAGEFKRRFDPSPRPSLRGKGARGHESAAAGNRCGGTGVSPIVPPSSTGQTPTATPIGRARHTRRRQLLPVSTTHAQEAARVVDGETRGVRGVGWVVGAGARRAGRPGSRRGRKAPGRLPGRLLLWAPAPPRLTNCRRCGKMLREGSHRRRSQRRPTSTVRQKPGRFRNDRALLYLGHHQRDHRRIKCA